MLVPEMSQCCTFCLSDTLVRIAAIQFLGTSALTDDKKLSETFQYFPIRGHALLLSDKGLKSVKAVYPT